MSTLELRIAFEDHAQNGRGVERATRGVEEFLCCLVARIRALCASSRMSTKTKNRLLARAAQKFAPVFATILFASVLNGTEVRGTIRINGSSGQSLAAVVVYAEALNERVVVRPGQYQIVQKNKTFIPHVLAVPIGSTVTFPNDDPIFHNVFSLSAPTPFDLGLYRAGSAKTLVFAKPAVYRVFCNIHPQMTALLLVLPTNWIAVPDEQGAFRLDLPGGAYRVTAWSERAAPVSASATVGSSAVTIPEMVLDESGFVEAAHKNKFGQDYPRSAYEPTNR
jgi:plastocyanin